mgnify:CR=1 FL=1|jgi:crotonobetainyl-CoA:carnitine CoA-transferase CaiB-like acyl-CoA transferase|tara:strand:+ start:6064 stop:8415 length:2352 start_codon:yes stop_codon:yes gene_type:complete
MGALAKTRILELSSSIAAAYCARQFALWGAEVITVGDEWRTSPRQYPTYSVQGTGHSLLQEFLHIGKRFIEGPEVTADLIEHTDILITDRPREDLQKSPGFREVSRWPIVVDISPFGRSGPYANHAATELTVEAVSGFLSINGARDRAPLRMPGNLIGYICGVSSFIAGLAALHRFHHSGISEQVEVSWMETLTTIVPLLRTQLEWRPEQRDGGPGVKPLGVRLYRVGQRYLSLGLNLPSALEVLLDVLGLDETDIPEHLDTLKKRQDYKALFAFVESLKTPFDVDELFKILSELPHRSVVGKVQTPMELIADPQLQALGFLHRVKHPSLGEITLTGPPARMSKTPANHPSPATLTTVSGATWSRREEVTSAAPVPSDRPLGNIRIIDLTQAWIGPYASQLLGDLGAEVIKVESHLKPDVWRMLPPTKPKALVNHRAQLANTSNNFNSVNRGKKSLTLDLSTPRGRQLFLQLVADADVVMENYTRNVMKRFRLGYEDLKKVNPNLIMISFSGYGKVGPYADYRATGTTIEATAGWDSLFGYTDGPPLVMGFYQADAITGLQMAATTLAALNHRDRTGEGQYVEGSMLEAATGYIGELILEAGLGSAHTRFGNRHPDMAPHGVYPCSGQDQWVAIAVRDDQEFKRLTEIPGINVSDPALLETAYRLTQQDYLDQQISSWSSDLTPQEATCALQEVSIPAAPVQRTDQVLADPHLREWFQRLSHPDLGSHLYDGFPWRFSDSELASTSASPRLGQHSRELLRELLGLSHVEIDRLFRSGVSGEAF